LCVLDTDLRFVRVNAQFAETNGWPAAAHIGKTPGELNPDMGPVAEKMLRSVLETGQPLLGVEVTGVTAEAPGVTRTWIERSSRNLATRGKSAPPGPLDAASCRRQFGIWKQSGNGPVLTAFV
jgi:PAS domain-containing protein